MKATALIADSRPWLHRTSLVGICLGAFLLLLLALTISPSGVIILTTFAIVLLQAYRGTGAGLTTVAIVALLLPFAVVPLDLGLKPSFLNIVIALVYLQWLVQLIRQETSQSLPPFTSGLVLLFGFLVVAATFWGFNFERPTPFDLRKILEYLLNLGLFFVTLTVLRTPQIRRLVATIAISGVIAALAGLILYWMPTGLARDFLGQLETFDYPAGQVALRYIGSDPRNAMRAIGLAVDPNLLGVSCVFSACLILPFALSGHNGWLRIGAGLGLLLLLACIYLTYSRNALVALMAVGLFLATVRYRILFPLGAVGLLLLLLLPQTQPYVQRLIEGLLRQDLATQMRMTEYRNATELIRTYPWTGTGFFGIPSLEFQSGVSMIYLAVASYMGLPALGLYLVILLLPLLRFAQTPWRHHELEPYALGLAGIIVVFIMTGLFDHFYINPLYPHMSALFWILLGACTATCRLLASQSQASPIPLAVKQASDRQQIPSV